MESQQKQILLFPPTHEKSTPSFHVEGSLAEEFLGFLKNYDVPLWQPPEKLEKCGPDDHSLVEVTVEADTPLPLLERLLQDFQSNRN
jgi:hypothetical protein